MALLEVPRQGGLQGDKVWHRNRRHPGSFIRAQDRTAPALRVVFPRAVSTAPADTADPP